MQFFYSTSKNDINDDIFFVFLLLLNKHHNTTRSLHSDLFVVCALIEKENVCFLISDHVHVPHFHKTVNNLEL